LFTWSDGQTPGKRLLGHVVVDATTGVPFDWGRMALRQFVVQGLLGGLLSSITCSIYLWADALAIFGAGQRTLHDRMVNSTVRHL
jgi:RDD family